MEIRGRVETIETTTLFKNGLNTEKSPGDLSRPAVTQISDVYTNCNWCSWYSQIRDVYANCN